MVASPVAHLMTSRRTGERRTDRPLELFFGFYDGYVLRLAVADQPIQVHANVGGFRRGVGKRDSAIERYARLFVAAKLHQEGAAHAEKMKVVRQPFAERLDHL